MSLLDRLRKKKPSPAPAPSGLDAVAAVVPAPPLPDAVILPSRTDAAPGTQDGSAAQPENQEPTVRAFDEYGREVLLPASQWRAEVLPRALSQAADNPEMLAQILLDALQLGAAEEVLPAASKLLAIDPIAERGTSLYGMVLLAAGKNAEAEDVLVTYLGQQGPSAPVLANLARAQAAQGRVDEADETLWRALEADPNHDTALGLYSARSREREGDFGWQSALERAATLPGAWLPLLWLGRSALEARNRTLALGMYKQALERGGYPAPVVLLQGVSGDLGQFGLLEDALRLSRPLFDPEIHGLAVGNNLIKASLDLGRTSDAMTLVRELRQGDRPELAEALRTWEIEVRRSEMAARTASNPPEPQLLRVDGPVWLPPGAPARELYATEAARRASVLFLGSSAQVKGDLAPELGAQISDMAARLSRALPLFLSEGAYALLGLETTAFVPWANTAGFAVLNQPWPAETAAEYAREAGAGAAVAVNLEATEQGVEVTVEVIPAAPVSAAPLTGDLTSLQETAEDAADAAAPDPVDPPSQDQPEPARIRLNVTWNELHTGALGLWAQLAHHLVSHFGDTPEPPRPGRYTFPRDAELNLYLRYLEQTLGVSCASTSPNGVLLLHGERETMRGLIDLLMRYPQSLPLRLMLGDVIVRLRALHPEVLVEFAPAIGNLVQRFPLSDPRAAELWDAQIREVYTITQGETTTQEA